MGESSKSHEGHGNTTLDLSDSREERRTCILCCCETKKVNGRKVPLTKISNVNTINSIKEIAVTLNNHELLQKLENDETLAYHSNCFSSFQMKKKMCLEVGLLQIIILRTANFIKKRLQIFRKLSVTT